MSTATKWWHTDGDRIVCDLCPRECAMHEGQRGFCFVRQNVAGRMELTTYGKSTGFCIDPIEKKPLNHFLPGTPVLSFGTAGCNLGCKFCQNWSISKAREIEKLSETASPRAIAEAAKSSGCRSVAFTYNDPVIWAEYAIDTAVACRELGIKTVAVTAGYIQPCAREEFYSAMDAANVDLKAFTETFYKYLTFAKLKPVLDTLVWLKHESNVWFEITDLIIPEENDSVDEIARMCDWIVKELGRDVPVHFTAFHPDFRLRHRPPTPHKTLVRARQQALDAGIKYVYVGNVHDVERQSTYCPNCGVLLIERDWHELGAYQMRGSQCGACGTEIPGMFEEQRGDWGRRRQPVAIPEMAAIKPVAPDGTTQPAGAPACALPPESVYSVSSPSRLRANQDALEAAIEPSSGPKIDFSPEECAAILAYTRAQMEAAVRGVGETSALPDNLGQAPTFGVFVTLRRKTLLRACRGRWGEQGPLTEVLCKSIADAASKDVRFPTIGVEELPLLNVEISLMFDPRTMTSKGVDRVGEVEIGRHGLVISHPRGRGLLLPQVATEAGWDAESFLSHLCRKASLPVDAWQEDRAELMTFQARVLHSPAPIAELDVVALEDRQLDELVRLANAQLEGQRINGEGASSVLTARHAEELGVFLQTTSELTAASTGKGQSLLQLTFRAVEQLRGRGVSGSVGNVIERLTLMWQSIHLRGVDYPQRHNTSMRSAILARTANRWSISIPRSRNARNPIDEALAGLRMSARQWQRDTELAATLTAYCTRQHTIRSIHRVPGEVRLPARAGQFYPAEAAEIERELDRYLAAPEDGATARYRAVMLPHAGWGYCGSIIGKTLGAVDVPKLAIVVSPKHTADGPPWSVSSAERWQLPGISIPVEASFRDQLLARVPELACESAAHSAEHGVEVLLPFLYRKNPELNVVPIVLGFTAYERTETIARALGELVATMADPPLLVISSDMNHFANEAENRRLDFMALDAMRTGNPRHLYDVVCRHRISMCGIIPAVTIMQALVLAGQPLDLELVDYTNSGLVTGDCSRVVGYAGMLIH